MKLAKISSSQGRLAHRRAPWAEVPVAKEVIDYNISLYKGGDPPFLKVGNNTRDKFKRGQLSLSH
jgi:hypothetical protein